MIFQRTKKLPNGKALTYKHWWYQFQRDGVFVRVNTKQNSKRGAEELEAAHRTRLAKGEVGLQDGTPVPTLKEFKQRFMATIEARCVEKPRTAEFYKQKMANLLAFAPLANARLDRIDEALIEKFIHHRRKQFVRRKKDAKKYVTPATVNRALGVLRRALRLAQEWKLIHRVPRIRMLPGEHEREFVLSRENEPAYLEACRQPLKDLATLVLDTGLRAGEALGLEWRDVRLEPIGRAKYGSLRVRGGKSRYAKRVISLTKRAGELLAARQREGVDQFVFSSSNGRPYRDTYLARLQQRVREKLGWSNEFVIHSLRHTMLTRLGEAGVDAFTIMRIAGHSSITVSQRYVHPTPESLENAFEKLESYSRTAITQVSEVAKVATPPLQGAANTQARALSTAVSAADS